MKRDTRKRMIVGLGLLAGAACAAPEADRVAFSLHSGDGGTNFTVRWSYPPALRPTFQSATSDVARTALGIAALRRQEAAGDRRSAFELGYLHLFGIGMTQNLAEAEVRLRTGIEVGRPEGVFWMADALAWGRGGDRDLPKAGELVHASLAAGYEPAVPLGVWLAKRRERPSLAWLQQRIVDERLLPAELAEQILRAVLKIAPDHVDALLELADVRLRAEDPKGAWLLATRSLEVPGISARMRVQARLLRVATAQKAGKVAELGMVDVREIASALPRRTARIVGLAIAVVGSLVSAGLLALWTCLTRRCGERGPGWFLTGGWVALHALIFGVGILHPVAAAVTAGLLASAIMFALVPSIRRRLFPVPRPGSARAALRSAVAVAGGLAVIASFNAAYEAVYTWWAGHPPDLQLVAAFLRTDNALDAALLLFAVAVCIPVIEETVFRGFLTDRLRRRLGPWAAAVVAAGIFGLIHGFPAAPPVAVIGLVAGWLRLRTGALWLPVLLHGLINGAAVLML